MKNFNDFRNYVLFNFRNVLIIVQPENDRVVIIPYLSFSGDVASLTIDQTIKVMEKIKRERPINKTHGKISRS